jgi:8-hydroxy-5-deazaflavin:NADPH oxidoreductase
MPIERLAIVGGTGPQGRGLALRFATAGYAVVVGSRERAKAEGVVDAMLAAHPGLGLQGDDNASAIADADAVVLALAPDGLAATIELLRDRLVDRLVIDVVVPLALRDGLAEHAPPPGAASAGELVQAMLPQSRVVGAFKTIPASHLLALGRPLAGDVLVCGDDAAARADVAALVARIDGLRAVDAGAMRNARAIEGITALLVNLNRAHHAHTSIRILGLD